VPEWDRLGDGDLDHRIVVHEHADRRARADVDDRDPDVISLPVDQKAVFHETASSRVYPAIIAG
jgi:hypothetical protein